MTLQDWMDKPYCHDPLHLNRFHASRSGSIGLDMRERLPLHDPVPVAGRAKRGIANRRRSQRHQTGTVPTTVQPPSEEEP